MTANVTEPDREACLDAGMDDIVAKPVMIDLLGEILARWHPQGLGTAVASHPVHQVRDPRRLAHPLDVHVLRRLRDDLGAHAFSRFLDVYLRELPGREGRSSRPWTSVPPMLFG